MSLSVIAVLIALAIIIPANMAELSYAKESPSVGCQKIKGISGLPLTDANTCDTRDACDIISPGAKCESTAWDRLYTRVNPAFFPIMTCSSNKCSASSPPTGKTGVLQCKSVRLYGNYCACPLKTTAVYECGICNSPASSTCFCCSGKA